MRQDQGNEQIYNWVNYSTREIYVNLDMNQYRKRHIDTIININSKLGLINIKNLLDPYLYHRLGIIIIYF